MARIAYEPMIKGAMWCTHTRVCAPVVCARSLVPTAAQRGLAPRVFEYLFERINKEEDAKVK
jgi:hypothetical protein